MKNRRLSSGVVVFRWDAHQRPLYLLLRAYQYWDFPKGMVEPGELPKAAAEREVIEETGLTGLIFHWGDVWRETEPYSAGKVARYYLAESRAGEVYLPVNPKLGHPEHDEFRWIAFEHAMPILAERVKPILNWAHRLVIRQRLSDE